MGSDGVRVLTIIHGFPPLRGGGEIAAFSIATQLVGLGCEVRVLTSALDRLPAFQAVDGIPTHRVAGSKRVMGAFTPRELLAFYFRARQRVSSIIHEFQPDLLHAHFAIPAGLLAWQQWKRRGVPYILTCHGSDVPGFTRTRYSRLYGLLAPVFRRVCADAARVVFVSRSLRDHALRIEPRLRPAVVPNGVDHTVFFPRTVPRPDDRTLGVLFVGRLTRVKGVHVLLAALPKVLEATAGTTVSLTVVGDGEERERLGRLADTLGIADRVRFRGFLRLPALAEEYREADLFAFPSLGDAFGLTIVEAMASGLPVVASRVGGIPELLEEADLLTEPGDADALAGKLTELAADPALRHAIGQRNFERSVKLHWQEIGRAYRDLLERATAREADPAC